MAEFQTVMHEFRRLCKGRRCADCPIREKVTKDIEIYCSAWVKNNSKEAESIIMKWASEHPITTNRMKFREVFGEDMMAMLTGEHAPLGDWLDAEYKKVVGYEDDKKAVPPRRR